MKTYLITLILGFISTLGFAHQPEVSSTVLAQKENNVWVLQISASLTAFQQEINIHYADTPYKTPEEFREMVIEHIKNKMNLKVNGAQLNFTNGAVHLGHETKVIFEVQELPEDLNFIEVTNTAFEDIYNSKSFLVVLKDGVDENKFVLSKDNGYHANLLLTGNKLVQNQESQASLFSWPLIAGIFGLLFIGLLVARFKSKQAA
ncbi:hypothetical protein LX97_00575 [Nonlabens dokdonensis]|uniref:Secreted protein n=2 Tax=Nonlabens dokdonensis TaxID=328515 RepID=L7WAI9_NONDD|nr:DUF6702 family protein [Nonlabens dokdonensis]AGC75893.1 hypothetical protein DDD_0766 [Nonlabens dokdonensis DSW-6]PZX43574.1 hypothetical protein LX97_00575 [Nonlabens dokdonensis]